MEHITNFLQENNISVAIVLAVGMFACVVMFFGLTVFSSKKKETKKPKKRGEKTDTGIQPPQRNVKVERNTSSNNTNSKDAKDDKKAKSARAKELRKELRELDKQRHAKSKLPLSVQQTIPYTASYDNGVLELCKTKTGKYKYSVCFAFEDINYSTLKPDEAKVKFMRYVDLLNGLPPECDAFLILHNQKRSLESVMEEIKIPDRDEPGEETYNEYRHIYNDIMAAKILTGSSAVRKERYFVITIEAANQLEAFSTFTRIESEITSAFKAIGSRAKRTSSMERFIMLHDFYRPKHIGELEKQNLPWKEMAQNLISMKDYICSDSIVFHKDYIEIDDVFAKCVFINDYPSIMSDKFLGEITNVNFTSLLSLSIHPIKMDDGIKIIRKQILGMESNKQEAQKKAVKAGYSPDMINHHLKESLDDAEIMLNDVQKDNQKLFETGYIYMITGSSKEELDRNTNTIQTIASKYLCQIRLLPYQQEQALNQVLPYGYNDLPIKRTLTTNSTAIFMPFVAKEMMQTEDLGKGRGFYYGVNAISGNLIFFNRLYLLNANGFILGASGSGKSFATKREVLNVLLNTNKNNEVIIIDPDGEYAPFIKGFGGEHIIVSPDSTNYINPMEMDRDYNIQDNGKVGDPIRGKSDFILSLCEEALAIKDMGITPTQRSFIDKCVRVTYREFVEHDFAPEYEPTFKELQASFDNLAKFEEEWEIARSFELYSSGSLNVFSHRTNVNINKRLVCYDISMLGKSLNTMGQLIMLDAVWNRVLKNRKKGIRTWLYSDEFTVLLRKESSKVFFLDTFKRIRKMGGSCTGLTQNITSLYRDDDAMEMLANAEFVYMLNQAPTDRVQLASILNMSETELEYVSDVDKGCGIIKAGRHIIPFKDQFPKDNVLYEMMTTDPEERKKIDNLGDEDMPKEAV